MILSFKTESKLPWIPTNLPASTASCGQEIHSSALLSVKELHSFMCCLNFSFPKSCWHNHTCVTFSTPLMISSPWYALCCRLLRLKSFSLFNNSSHRLSLLIVLAIFICTERCNLYYPVSFHCYLLCTISHSTASFEVQQRGRRYSCTFQTCWECIYIVILWFFSVLFSLLFLINLNIQFQLGFWVCWGFLPLGAQSSHTNRTRNTIISFLNDNNQLSITYRLGEVKTNFSNIQYFTFIYLAFHTSITWYHFYNSL